MKSNRLITCVVGAAIVAAVLAGLRVPFSSLLPFAVLLACPLMMLLMMRGMGGMHKAGEDHTGHGLKR